MGTRKKILFLIIVSFIIINYSINTFLKPATVSYEGINTELSLKDNVEVFALSIEDICSLTDLRIL